MKWKQLVIFIYLFALSAINSSIAEDLQIPGKLNTGISYISHNGGTDVYGCHYDSSTGTYHCH